MAVVIQIVGAADGSPHPFEGKYLKAYDPDGDPANPYAGHIEVTNRFEDAKRYGHMDAFGEWKRVSTMCPRRPDGRPNRPLTAFTVEFITVSDD